LWDCSVALGFYLEKHADRLVFGKHVVEMGAGTALAGLAAWQLGGRVTITDLEENLHLPRTSVELNSPTKECPVERVGITSLDWLSQSDPERLVAERGRADTIIAADVLWLEDLVDDFARCLRTICTAETTVVLAYQERATTVSILMNCRRTPCRSRIASLQACAPGSIGAQFQVPSTIQSTTTPSFKSMRCTSRRMRIRNEWSPGLER